jgi:hypothetical protein
LERARDVGSWEAGPRGGNSLDEFAVAVCDSVGGAIHAAYLGMTLLERGDLERAAAVVEGVTLTPALLEMPLGPALIEARGRVRLACGQREQAIADLRHCGHYAKRWI